MNNAAAAYYAYLAHADRQRAQVLRRFGYIASADYVERRAAWYERQSKEAPQDEPCGASSPSHFPETSDLHKAP